MKTRIRRIMEMLLKQHRPLKPQELAVLLEMSEKTIRDEITRFCNEQENTDVVILLTNDGYVVKTGLDTPKLKEYLNELDKSCGQDKDERDMLMKLLLSDQFIKLEDIAEEFYISLPTVYRMFKSVKSILKKYEIQVISKPGYGVRLSGKEKNIRLCFIHCYADNLHMDIHELLNLCQMQEEDYYLLNYIVQKILTKYDYVLTETGLNNLIVHLIYAVSRIRQKKYIEKMDDSLVSTNYRAHIISKEVIESIEKEFQITFPESEVAYVEIHILCKKVNIGNEEYFISEPVEKLIRSILVEIKNNLGLDFNSDMELFTMLSMHFEPMLSRVAMGIRMPNPVLEEIKSKFNPAYECAVIASNVIWKTLGLRVSDHELGYVALHFSLAIQRLSAIKTLRFMVVCSSGMGTAKFLAKKIEMQFEVSKEHIVFESLQNLLDADLKDIDYVVSTVKIPYKLDKPILYLENILAEIQIQDQKQIHYRNFLNSQFVFFSQDFCSKEEALKFICNKIQEAYSDCDTIYEQIMHRESLSGTDIGNYVAIPHPFEAINRERIFCYVSLKRPIFWNTKKVKYIFLVSHPSCDFNYSHKINEDLFAKIMNPAWILKLDKIEDYESLIELLEEE